MRVLIVEDEPALAQRLGEAFEDAGFLAAIARDGVEGEYRGATETFDLAVLDIGLPGLDGIEVLTRWRAQGAALPVLILTARDAWSDKVRGFRAGADDYVLKPFRLEEVVLRGRALVRRAAGHAGALVEAGGLALDTQTGLVTLDGLALRLTAFEARILRYLILQRGRIVSRTELTEHVYDHGADRDFRSLEVVIGRLRRKVGAGRIETLRGEGYRLLPGPGPGPGPDTGAGAARPPAGGAP